MSTTAIAWHPNNRQLCSKHPRCFDISSHHTSTYTLHNPFHPQTSTLHFIRRHSHCCISRYTHHTHHTLHFIRKHGCTHLQLQTQWRSLTISSAKMAAPTFNRKRDAAHSPFHLQRWRSGLGPTSCAASSGPRAGGGTAGCRPHSAAGPAQLRACRCTCVCYHICALVCICAWAVCWVCLHLGEKGMCVHEYSTGVSHQIISPRA